jgi:hypothetical protein
MVERSANVMEDHIFDFSNIFVEGWAWVLDCGYKVTVKCFVYDVCNF